MAQIHGISGSTRYLIRGIHPMQGKRLETLEEIRHFYSHHEIILVETKETISRAHDEKIADLANDEVRLDRQLQDALAQTTHEVDSVIQDLHSKSRSESGFLTRAGFRVQHWIAVVLRDHHIRRPCSPISNELWRTRSQKRELISTKESRIQRECNNISRSYEFLKRNESFMIGALGEEEVIGALSGLPDEFHVINDVNLHFSRSIHWRKYDEYIRNCQIDHIVVGPTGVFLLETKNWKSSDIEVKSEKLRHQVQRENLALWYYLKERYGKPSIRTVIVSMKGYPSGVKPDKYIDILSLHQVNRYITRRNVTLSDDAIGRLVRLLDVR